LHRRTRRYAHIAGLDATLVMVLFGTRLGRTTGAFSQSPATPIPACDTCSHRSKHASPEDIMFTKTLLFVGLLVAAPISSAASTAELARETGLSERNIRMILGARTPYAEYRIDYNRKLRQFKQVVGEDNYQRLMNGEAIVLQRKARDETRPIASVEPARP